MCRVNVLAMFLYVVRKMKENGVFICQVQVLTRKFKVTNCALGHSKIYSGTVSSCSLALLHQISSWLVRSEIECDSGPKAHRPVTTSSVKAENSCLQVTVLIYVYCALGPVSVHGAGLHGLRQPPLTTQDWLHGHIRRFQGYSFHITILKLSSSVRLLSYSVDSIKRTVLLKILLLKKLQKISIKNTVY